MRPDDYSIEVKNLKKTFQVRNREGGLFAAKRYLQIEAVRDISFSIPKGEIVGLIGSNGAGKSTTVKMLTGILTPDQGSIRIRGMDYRKNRRDILMQIGVVFGQRSVLCWDIPIVESFRLFRDMYSISEQTYRKNMDIFSELLNLKEYLYQPPRLLSLGQRTKADLAAALLYDPEILFLDEPTIGIDVLAKDRIREFIKVINRERHTTVVLTTHDVSDIEALCHKMLVIDRGSLLYDGTLQGMKEQYLAQCGETSATGEIELEHIIKQIYEGSFL